MKTEGYDLGAIPFLTVLRGIAASMVVYCHLIGNMGPKDWFIVPWIDKIVIDPLRIIWDFGYLGVAVFFLISGFIIAYIAQREDRFTFVLRRIFRIFPPLFVASLLALILLATAGRAMPLTDAFCEMVLACSSFKLISPTYTLVIEVQFYILAALLLPAFRHYPHITVVAVATVPLIANLILNGNHVLSSIQNGMRFLGYAQHIPLFAIGIAIYYSWSGRIRFRSALTLSLLSWASFVLSTGSGEEAKLFQQNAFYAVTIFLAFLLLNPAFASLRRGPVRLALGWLGAVSYSLYLLHVPVGKAVISTASPYIGYSSALGIALVAVGIACHLSYRLIEVPSQRFARTLTPSEHSRTKIGNDLDVDRNKRPLKMN